jgi:hypothetical protein
MFGLTNIKNTGEAESVDEEPANIFLAQLKNSIAEKDHPKQVFNCNRYC